MGYRDPDDVVRYLGSVMKSLGWNWSLNREGLGWSSTLLGEDRKKKCKMIVRIGVKGRGRGRKSGQWPKGELSVGLHTFQLTYDSGWLAFQDTANHLIREYVRGLGDTGLEITFTDALSDLDVERAEEWMRHNIPQWKDGAADTVLQIEFLHEEGVRVYG